MLFLIIDKWRISTHPCSWINRHFLESPFIPKQDCITCLRCFFNISQVSSETALNFFGLHWRHKYQKEHKTEKLTRYNITYLVFVLLLFKDKSKQIYKPLRSVFVWILPAVWNWVSSLLITGIMLFNDV